ncbi:MAG: hypothetical protein Q8P24_02400 [Desulfobacterales bacterium]|nr:hypothetical protein [Desulfobacterales bacterium]
MIKKIVIALFITSLIFSYSTPKVAYAGGAGGEPLMSDSVGWGIVGAMAIAGVYFVYMTKQEMPPDREKPEEKAENLTPVKTDGANLVAPRGDLVVAKW